MSNNADSGAQAARQAVPKRPLVPAPPPNTLKGADSIIAPQPASSTEATNIEAAEQTKENGIPKSFEKLHSGSKDPKAFDKPTTPPRVSFGVEIEFLVACQKKCSGGYQPDPDPDLGLPPVFPGINNEAIRRVADVLLSHGIPVRVKHGPWRPPNYDKMREKVGANDYNCWTVDTDSTIDEVRIDEYVWQGVEITSPASYAYDEAFQMIETVTTIIKTNFRTRVNTSCGLHVHVGNGPHRIDFRASRNYAALLWAAEPLLSTLHYAERAVLEWSTSTRRTASSLLAEGKGAEDAYAEVMEDPRWPARYQGRVRKLGEAPVASRVKFLERIRKQEKNEEGLFLEPECPSDDEDWETGKPFHRPTKVMGERRTFKEDVHKTQKEANKASGLVPTEKDMAELDACRVRGGPPQIDFPLPERIRKLHPDRTPPKDKHCYELEGTQLQRPTMLERTLPPLRERHNKGPLPHTLQSITKDKNVQHRMSVFIDNIPTEACMMGPTVDQPNPYMAGFTSDEYVRMKQPKRRDTWSGVKEILACDVGTAQVSYLMGKGWSKNASQNWEGHNKEMLSLLQGTYNTYKPSYMTVENRYAAGSMDGEWIATWARINCRLLAFARDAAPAAFMRIIGVLAEQDGKTKVEYDVVDFLEDIGCFVEAQHCLRRLDRGAEALFECMHVKDAKDAAPSETGQEEEDLIDLDAGPPVPPPGSELLVDVGGEEREEEKEKKEKKGRLSLLGLTQMLAETGVVANYGEGWESELGGYF